MENKDDGSLSFLNIPRNVSSRSFNCDITTQNKLSGETFWILDFIEDVPTRVSKEKGKVGQTLVKIKYNLEDSERNARKFFTGSDEILYILQQIRERDAFPRKVTLRNSGNKYYLE